MAINIGHLSSSSPLITMHPSSSLSSSRSILRIREKYLLFAIIIIFMIISLIGMAYLPELKTSKVYLQYADSLGPQLLGLIPPQDNNQNNQKYHQQEDQQQQQIGVLPPPPPRARYDDEKRLREKIQQHYTDNNNNNNNSQQDAVIPKPLIQQSSLNDDNKHQQQTLSSSSISLYNNDIIRRQTNWTKILLPNGNDSNEEIRKKREKIKEMMINAWDNYKKYAWGENELKPLSKKGHSPSVFGKTKLGATIIDGMDTLYIMGLMDRFEDGKKWISENLDFNNVDSEISVFETIIRFVGGLLTCYAFTKDEMFLLKAINITNLMLPAFNTETGIPMALIKPSKGKSRNYIWAHSNSILSEIGTLSLEFSYLSALTGNQIYFNKIDRIQTILDSLQKPDGLYPNYINPNTGKFGQKHVSLGALGDSFYEYLLKLWLMTDKKDTTSLRMYNEAIDAIDKKLVQKSATSGLVYVADLRYERLEHKMGHLACFSAGMFAMGAKQNAHDEHRAEHYLQLGIDIAETCHESYIRTKTNIGPEVFWFNDKLEAQSVKKNERYYILRPEVIEGWFYLWRITKNEKYRQWAWDTTLVIEKYCSTSDNGGYTGIKDVENSNNVEQDDVQQSFFLAETLKYLYLIFSNDNLISFDQWVFNSEGHPLPIKNHNNAYPT